MTDEEIQAAKRHAEEITPGELSFKRRREDWLIHATFTHPGKGLSPAGLFVPSRGLVLDLVAEVEFRDALLRDLSDDGRAVRELAEARRECESLRATLETSEAAIAFLRRELKGAQNFIEQSIGEALSRRGLPRAGEEYANASGAPADGEWTVAYAAHSADLPDGAVIRNSAGEVLGVVTGRPQPAGGEGAGR